MKTNKRAFTLIELLTAMSIAVVLLAALAALVAGAFRVVKVLDARKKALLENSLIAVEKMGRELQQSPVYPPIAFEGEKEKISFPMLFAASEGGAINAEFRLGQVQEVKLGQGFAYKKVSYYLDHSRKALVRQVESDLPQEVLSPVEGLEFLYAIASIGSPQWTWESKTPGSGSPNRIGAVGVRVKFDNAAFHYSIPGIEKTFYLVRRHPLHAMKSKGEELKEKKESGESSP